MFFAKGLALAGRLTDVGSAFLLSFALVALTRLIGIAGTFLLLLFLLFYTFLASLFETFAVPSFFVSLFRMFDLVLACLTFFVLIFALHQCCITGHKERRSQNHKYKPFHNMSSQKPLALF